MPFVRLLTASRLAPAGGQIFRVSRAMRRQRSLIWPVLRSRCDRAPAALPAECRAAPSGKQPRWQPVVGMSPGGWPTATACRRSPLRRHPQWWHHSIGSDRHRTAVRWSAGHSHHGPLMEPPRRYLPNNVLYAERSTSWKQPKNL